MLDAMGRGSPEVRFVNVGVALQQRFVLWGMLSVFGSSSVLRTCDHILKLVPSSPTAANPSNSCFAGASFNRTVFRPLDNLHTGPSHLRSNWNFLIQSQPNTAWLISETMNVWVNDNAPSLNLNVRLPNVLMVDPFTAINVNCGSLGGNRPNLLTG